VALTVPPTVPPSGTLPVSVAVTNNFAGHSIPSGVSFSREMWIELVVKDAAGHDVQVSGRLDANGDLPSDPDLAIFHAILRDANGNRTFFTFRAKSIDARSLIRYAETRTASYAVTVPPGTPGPLTVDATLHFRPVSPALVRSLQLDRLLPIQVFDMWTGEASVAVP
jgi:hypothetical protein